ncbi:MAG TPA: hypothetical protein VF177_00545 [Anaerolineae bacterium]
MLTDNAVSITRKVTLERETAPSAEAHLHASRRVDWRFLLPNPNLGRVAYVGVGQGELINSLRLFSNSLTVLASPEVGKEADYDVVVAHDPESALLPAMTQLVSPGGYLYVELYGTTWWLRKGKYRGFRQPAKYVAQLRRSGLSDIHSYWQWPNFEACTRVIPLDCPSSLRFVLSLRRDSAVDQVKAMAVEGLIRSGLLDWLVPCFSLIAQRVKS